MTTTEKLTLLLNEANDDFSNVEIVQEGKTPITLQSFHAFIILLSDKYELRIKEQL